MNKRPGVIDKEKRERYGCREREKEGKALKHACGESREGHV